MDSHSAHEDGLSALEEDFALQCKLCLKEHPEREYRFHPERLWRFDFAWPPYQIALEVEGGTWVRGRHSRGTGMKADCEKYNAAVLMGWKVLRVTSDMVRDGSALNLAEQALKLWAVESLP